MGEEMCCCNGTDCEQRGLDCCPACSGEACFHPDHINPYRCPGCNHDVVARHQSLLALMDAHPEPWMSEVTANA